MNARIVLIHLQVQTRSVSYHHKLAINIAYAPYSYVVRKCVPACIETSQTFGGGSVLSTCCTTNLCNASSMITFPSISRIVLFILIILNVIKSVY
ncbi:unnamed protein product [Rotaria sp. Silwood2]|nr:unnamed protein product [Rotaria sp. Silwood2]